MRVFCERVTVAFGAEAAHFPKDAVLDRKNLCKKAEKCGVFPLHKGKDVLFYILIPRAFRCEVGVRYFYPLKEEFINGKKVQNHGR